MAGFEMTSSDTGAPDAGPALQAISDAVTTETRSAATNRRARQCGVYAAKTYPQEKAGSCFV